MIGSSLRRQRALVNSDHCPLGFLPLRRQQDLFRVLKAYTLYRPEEGYCQAQAPIAAVLLMHMPAEVPMPPLKTCRGRFES